MESNVGTLATGEEVFVSAESHYHTHVDVQPFIRKALSKISWDLSKVDWRGTAKYEVEMKECGCSICVPIRPTDKFVFAKRSPRTWYSRFVIGRKPLKTHKITIVLKPSELGLELVTTFWGPKSEPEPSDPMLIPGTEAYKASEEFWKHYALALPKDEKGQVCLGINPKEITEALPPNEKYFR
jgi:hypothetical protein